MDHRHECREMIQALSDYVDGNATQELCDRIEAHLAECPDCTVMVNTLRKTILLYRKAEPEGDIPAPVRLRLYRALHLDDLLSREPPEA